MGVLLPWCQVIYMWPLNRFMDSQVIGWLLSLTGTYTMCLTLEMVQMWSKATVTAPWMTTSGTMLSSPETTATRTAWKWTLRWSLRLSMVPKTWIWKVKLGKKFILSRAFFIIERLFPEETTGLESHAFLIHHEYPILKTLNYTTKQFINFSLDPLLKEWFIFPVDLGYEVIDVKIWRGL